MPREQRLLIAVMNLPVPDDTRVWAQAIAARDAGYHVEVICPAYRRHRPGRHLRDGVDVVYFPAFEGRGPASTVAESLWNTVVAALLMSVALVRRRPSVMQVCNPPDTLFPVLWLARRRGVRTVYDHHDVAPAMARARPAFRRLTSLLRWLEARTVAASDSLVTTSLEQVGRLRNLYNVEAVLVRTAPAPRSSSEPSAGTEADGGGPSVRLGFLGVIGEQDSVVDLVRCARLLDDEELDFEILVAGDGPYLPSLREECDALDVGHRVKFLGWLEQDEIGPFLAGLDFVVVPDGDSEYNHYCALNKVTHAMSRGIPVVARPLRETINVVGDAAILASGFSVEDLADAVRTAVGLPPERRADLTRRVRARYEEIASWEDHSRRYLAALAGT